MGDTVSALSYKADVPGRMRESAGQKKDALTGTLTGARDAITGSTGDSAKRTVGMAQSNPLGLAIGAAAIGFVAGSLLPETRIEEEKLGPMAAEARQQVSELAGEAVEHGKQVAEETMQAAKETATQSGQQHAQQLRESAQQPAKDMV